MESFEFVLAKQKFTASQNIISWIASLVYYTFDTIQVHGDVNSWIGLNHKIHNHWSPTKNGDSTVYKDQYHDMVNQTHYTLVNLDWFLPQGQRVFGQPLVFLVTPSSEIPAMKTKLVKFLDEMQLATNVYDW